MEKTPEKSTDVQPERLRNVLRDLVNIYSPTFEEEEVCTYAERYLKNHGLPAIRQEVKEEGHTYTDAVADERLETPGDVNRFNVIVPPKNKDKAELWFVGHLDTVSVAQAGVGDHRCHEEGDTVFGLGSADMKAGCAAMMEAFTVLASKGDSFPPVGLALVVGEEVNGSGAKTLMKEYSFPWAVIGEPTNMVPLLGHYGFIEVLFRTRGKKAHAAFPELGQNAIEPMLRLLLQVTDYADSMPDKLVCNLRQLAGGVPPGYVVPDSCEAWLDIHLPPDSKIQVVKTELEKLVQGADKSIPGLDADISFVEAYPGYRIREETSFVKRLKQAYEDNSLSWEPQDYRDGSDAWFLLPAGASPIILGPGRLEICHCSRECVSFNQVVQAAQLYVNLAVSTRSM